MEALKRFGLTVYLGIKLGGQNRFDINQGSLKRDGESSKKEMCSEHSSLQSTVLDTVRDIKMFKL